MVLHPSLPNLCKGLMKARIACRDYAGPVSALIFYATLDCQEKFAAWREKWLLTEVGQLYGTPQPPGKNTPQRRHEEALHRQKLQGELAW